LTFDTELKLLNIQTYMLYHGISPAHLHLDSTKFWWLVNWGWYNINSR